MGHRQQGAKPAPDSRIKPSLRVVAARPNRGNQSALGQTFEHHSVDARGGQHHGRIDPISGKACARTDDTNRRCHHKPM
jgi:hypothetical protein